MWSGAHAFVFLTISPGDSDGYNEVEMLWQYTDVSVIDMPELRKSYEINGARSHRLPDPRWFYPLLPLSPQFLPLSSLAGHIPATLASCLQALPRPFILAVPSVWNNPPRLSACFIPSPDLDLCSYVTLYGTPSLTTLNSKMHTHKCTLITP